MTSQLNEDDYDGLLIFAWLDHTTIDTLSILYSYNTFKSCNYRYNESNSIKQATAAVYICESPITAIFNKGEV